MKSEEIRAAAVREDHPPLDLPWEKLKRPGGKYDFNEAQKETFRKIVWAGKGAGVIAVGHGKSLVAFALPYLFGLRDEEVMLLHPKNLERTLLLQYAKFKDHFYLVMPQMVSYESFQTIKYNKIFGSTFRPRMIIADECQAMKRRSSTRFRRLVKYLREEPDTIYIPMTGTISARSIDEYAHTFASAFREDSPVPAGGQALKSWGRILDADKEPLGYDWDYFHPLVERYGETPPSAIVECGTRFSFEVEKEKAAARRVLRLHLNQTPGLTIIGESSVASTLYIKKHVHIGVPDRIKKVLKYMKEHKRLPAEGDFFETASAEAAAAAQVLQGFYYKWVWEDTVSVSDITDWKLARSDWQRAVRQYMDAPLVPEIHSPALLEQAVAIDHPHPDIRKLKPLLEAWHYQRDRVPAPTTVGVWLDDYMLDWVERWVNSMPPALVWYGPRIVGSKLSERLNVPHYGAGNPPPEDGMEGTGSHTGVATIAHRRGLNLQAWKVHLVVSPPAGGGVYEQLFGRSHRQGQLEDVRFDILCHHPIFKRRIDKALLDAKYAEESTGVKQKLQYGAWI